MIISWRIGTLSTSGDKISFRVSSSPILGSHLASDAIVTGTYKEFQNQHSLVFFPTKICVWIIRLHYTSNNSFASLNVPDTSNSVILQLKANFTNSIQTFTITFKYLAPQSSLSGIKADVVLSLSYIYFNEQDNKKRYREKAGEKHQKHLNFTHKKKCNPIRQL